MEQQYKKSTFEILIEKIVIKIFSLLGLLVVPYITTTASFLVFIFIISGFSLKALILGFFIVPFYFAPMHVLYLLSIYVLHINRWAIKSKCYIVVETVSFCLIDMMVQMVKDYCLSLDESLVFSERISNGLEVYGLKWYWIEDNYYYFIFALELAGLVLYDFLFVRRRNRH